MNIGNEEIKDFDVSSDESVYDSECSSILCVDSENDSDSEECVENSNPSFDISTQSYESTSENYNKAQNQVENDYIYQWISDEKVYDNDFSDMLLLSEYDKKEIRQKSFVELFEVFFSTELKNYILNATNENGYPLTANDFDIFVGILIFSSFNIRTSQKDYWSEKIHLKAESVIKAMNEEKFKTIKLNLKYALLQNKSDDDKIWKIRPILNIFRKNILKYGFFRTALSVDEMLIKCYGRKLIEPLIKTKSSDIRFSIKMRAICGSNGYLYDFDVFYGKNSKKGSKLFKITEDSLVTMQMLRELLTKIAPHDLSKYHLYFNNLFISPDLIIQLEKANLRATCVVRGDQIKKEKQLNKKTPKGTSIVKHNENSLMHNTIHNLKNITLLPTTFGAKLKDEQFSKYNQYMGGVNLHDLFCEEFLPSIRSKKWTWVMFLRILQSSISNAIILYNTVRSKKEKVSPTAFIIPIAREYLSRSLSSNITQHSVISHGRTNVI